MNAVLEDTDLFMLSELLCWRVYIKESEEIVETERGKIGHSLSLHFIMKERKTGYISDILNF